jgi:hypothetical protein
MHLLKYLLAIALLAAVATQGAPLPPPPGQGARDAHSTAHPTAPPPRDPAAR